MAQNPGFVNDTQEPEGEYDNPPTTQQAKSNKSSAKSKRSTRSGRSQAPGKAPESEQPGASAAEPGPEPEYYTDYEYAQRQGTREDRPTEYIRIFVIRKTLFLSCSRHLICSG